MKPITFISAPGLCCLGMVLLMVTWGPASHAWPATVTSPTATKPAGPPPAGLLPGGSDGTFLLAEGGYLRQRQRDFYESHQQAKIIVFPVLIGSSADTECAVNLAQLLPVAGICQACAVARPVVLPAGPSREKTPGLWSLARAFRERVKTDSSGADYALYLEYARRPDQLDWSNVRVVLCDARGDLVLADQLDLRGPGYRYLQPVAKHDCDELVVRYLTDFLEAAAGRPATGTPTLLGASPAGPLVPQPVHP